MKILVGLTLIISLMIIGCTENQQITSPVDDNSNLKMTGPDDPNNLDTESAILLDMIPVWINMPEPSLSISGSTFNEEKWVYNDRTNNVIIDSFYLGGIFGTVCVKLKLMFKPGDLPQDSMFITAEFDLNNGTIKFGPALVFISPARLDYKITGLDFSTMDPYNIRFIYAGDDGIVESVICENYTINESDGSIQMWKGEIPHFSRYGFVRRNVGH